MKKFLTLFLSLLIVLSVLFVVSCDKKEETPPPTKEELLDKAFDVSFSPKGEKATTLSSVMENALKAGSIELKAEELSEYIPFIEDISVKTYMADGKQALVISGKDAEGNNGSITAFIDGDKVVLSSSALENSYGITYDKLMELAGATTGMEEMPIDVDKLTALLETYTNEIKSLIDKYSTLALEPTENGYAFDYVISNENAHSILSDLITKIKADSELEAFFNGLEDTTECDFDEICQNLDDIASEFSEIGVMLSFAVNTDKDYNITNMELVLKCDFNEDEDSAKAEFEDIVSVNCTFEDDGTTIAINVLEYSFTILSEIKDSLTSYEQAISLEVSMPDPTGSATKVTFDILNIELNKLTKDYTVTLSIPQTATVVVTGKLDIQEESFLLSISKLTLIQPLDDIESSEEEISINATLVVNKADTIPQAPTTFEDISQLGEEDFEAIMLEVSEDPFFTGILSLFETMQ